YTTYFYIFLLLRQCLYLASFRRLKLNFKEITAFLIILISFIFYLPRFLSKFYYVKGGFWLPDPQARSLLVTLENFTLGYSGIAPFYFIVDILIGILLVSFFWNIRRDENRQNAVFCLFFFCMPVICAFLFSKIFFPVYIDRGLIISSPFFYLVLSSGMLSLHKKIKKIILLPFFASLILAACCYFGDWFRPSAGVLPKKPVRPVIEFLAQSINPDDIIAFANLSAFPSYYFYRGDKSPYPYFFFDPRFPDSNWHRPFSEGGYFISVHKVGQLAFRRLWLIVSDWNRSGKLDENSQSVNDELGRRFKLESAHEFDGLWIFEYSKK
ncbi:MAG: hypothetical protein PHF11_03085, partial [Candidatus Omnitrophica bacterium]|nr:hypothetical protein [Candidatus Omnitrophota bacterium]